MDAATTINGDLGVEQVVADLSAALVRAGSDEIDAEIERSLAAVVLALSLDRGTIGQLDPRGGALHVTHQWAREGADAPDIGSDVTSSLPWTANKLLRGELVVISRLEDFPVEAAEERRYAELHGGPCTVAIPLRIGGVIVGALSFGVVGQERQWSKRVVRRLQLIADIIGSALERKRAAEVSRNLEAELQRNARAVMLGTLTASLAHELSQPLTAILANAEAAHGLLQGNTLSTSEVREALEDIIRDDTRAVEIISRVRALFRRGEARMSSVDIPRLLREAERIVRLDAVTRQIELRVEAAPQLPQVIGDETLLTQVLLNLIVNAFDAVGEIGSGRRQVTLRAERSEEGFIDLLVRDNGHGIDPTILPRMFAPFFTTKSGGLGMGLAICRMIVEEHRGRIRALQNAEGGVTLQVSIPIVAA